MLVGVVLLLILELFVAVLSQGFTANVTRLLNSLLSRSYDQRIRPDIGGPPTKVTCNMHIKSLGPVEENDETFFMDIYFRQSWYDRRLSFSFPGIDELSMSWLFLEKIWKPDTYFINGKKSHLHGITSPNKFIRIRNDGLMTYSMRLTVASQCKMYLRKFPLDSQKCSLIIGSYGYMTDDVHYVWDESGVTIEKGVEMAQYDIVNVTTEAAKTALRGIDVYSVIEVTFYMRRSIGYFMLQIYVPITLVVCSSWISFWITPSDSSGRTSLGVTTVLSITTLGFGGRSSLPKVSYATALDWYVIICFAFAFAVMIEYAIINFMDKIAEDIRRLLEEETKKKSELASTKANADKSLVVDEELEEIDAESLEVHPKLKYNFLPHRWFSVPADLSTQSIRDDLPWTPVPPITPSSRRSPVQSWNRHALTVILKVWKNFNFLPQEKEGLSEKGFSQIDIVARRAFPLAFTITMTTYTLLYAYYITDMSDDDM
ncbi:gamma-aminobutyric acid receptor subunit alpha-6 isoform X2 [Halyomorpha halys]|uniref:gamma-aminobutyric acid receptor subunit alpha-6 isoform X2 n=1 Tax=Halyomorpha halys TaxID=286706 RepID=UPI0034D31A84